MSAENLRRQIAQLRSLSPEINEVTDEATRLILTVERFLTDECQFGIPAFVNVHYGSDDRNNVEEGRRIEYSRWEGKFRIVVSDFVTYPDGDTTISNRLPWVSCPRDLKLETIEYIPLLLGRISEKVQRTIREARKDSQSVRESLEAFGILSKEADK